MRSNMAGVSSQRALDFLRSQHFIAEGCAAASLSLAAMAASELSLAALQTVTA
jgi:hypothetical protein